MSLSAQVQSSVELVTPAIKLDNTQSMLIHWSRVIFSMTKAIIQNLLNILQKFVASTSAVKSYMEWILAFRVVVERNNN